jgi:hypothetical protein
VSRERHGGEQRRADSLMSVGYAFPCGSGSAAARKRVARRPARFAGPPTRGRGGSAHTPLISHFSTHLHVFIFIPFIPFIPVKQSLAVVLP